jgi:type II secretory pathway pseudopilin PulG
MKTFRVRRFPAVSRRRDAVSCDQVGAVAPRAWRRRRGISLLEVLISMGVLTVGLLSVASLLPLGRFQVQKAAIEDRKAVLGQNAFREFRIRNLSHADQWLRADGGSFFAGGMPYTGAVAIDPMMTTRHAAAAAQFPTSGSGPKMMRLGHTAAVTVPLANRIFMGHDNLLFDLPRDADSPPVAQWQRDNADNPLARQFDDAYSWLATLVPVYGDPASSAAMPRQQYILSIVVVHRRDFTVDGLAAEWSVQAVIAGADGRLIGGGDVRLSGPTDALKAIFPGTWLMLCGELRDANAQSGVRGIFRWYRVVTAEAYQEGMTERSVTLSGPDWHGSSAVGNLRAAVLPGAVAVYEKTIRLEGPSLWSN